MNIRTAICRLFLSALLAIFFISSLLDTFDQGNLFPALTAQLSCPAADNDSSLDKKKKFLAMGQTSFIFEIGQAREVLCLLEESFPSRQFIFSYFLRAPPLT